MIKRRDQLLTRLRTLGDPALVVLAPAPVTRIIPGVDADPCSSQMPGIDAKRTLACDNRFRIPPFKRERPRPYSPRRCILRNQLEFQADALACCRHRGVSLPPKNPNVRRQCERLVIAGDRLFVVVETAERIAEPAP